MSKTLLAVVTTAAALTFGANAKAELLPAGYETHSMTLRVDDLNLDHDAGARKMLARIVFAANKVCGEAGDNLDLGHRVRRRACVSAAVEQSLTKLDSPRVSALYGAPPQMTLAEYRGS